MNEPKSIRYKDAGVDVEAGDQFVGRIGAAVESTRTPRVLGGIGAFGGLFRADFDGYEDPVLVASADGIGTKLKVAFELEGHSSVGGDLVRHCVNDIAVMGAKPLFFLDYLATGALSPEVMAQVVEGMAGACRDEGVALLGGETAEMPGFYQPGEYDVAGFLVGIVDRGAILDGSGMKPGDRLVGFPSTGLHTNGYSLARRIVSESRELSWEASPPELGSKSVGEALLAPHRSYTAEIRQLIEAPDVEALGFAHVTGGGIGGNLKRILPDTVDARVDTRAFDEPPIFDILRRHGNVPEDDMRQAFNLGVGLVAVVRGEAPVGLALGEIVAGGGDVHFVD